MDNLEKAYFDDVLSRGIDAILPQNLSDFWLQILEAHAEQYVGGKKGGVNLCVVTVMWIIAMRRKTSTVEIEAKEFSDLILAFILETALQSLSRTAGIAYNEPTPIDFLTDRVFKISGMAEAVKSGKLPGWMPPI